MAHNQFSYVGPMDEACYSAKDGAFFSQQIPDNSQFLDVVDPSLRSFDHVNATNAFPTTFLTPWDTFPSEQNFNSVSTAHMRTFNGSNSSFGSASLVPRGPAGSMNGSDSPFAHLHSPTYSGGHSPLSLDGETLYDSIPGPSTPKDMRFGSPLLDERLNDQTEMSSWTNPASIGATEHSEFLTSDMATTNFPTEISGRANDVIGAGAYYQPPRHTITVASESEHLQDPSLNAQFPSSSQDRHSKFEHMISVIPLGVQPNARQTRRSSPSDSRNKRRSGRRQSTRSPACDKGPFDGSPVSSAGMGRQRSQGQSNNGQYICVFHFAGCPKRFSNKNEWKRHVSRQHINTEYWICREGSCAKNSGPSTHKRPQSLPAFGAIFNRKDLFSQHVRRMHASPEIRKALDNKRPPPEFIAKLEAVTERARQTRCEFPFHLQCPADGCNAKWSQPNAWDARMEHVGKHLEKAAAGEEPPVRFGGDNDHLLREWAEKEAHIIVETSTGWKLSQPLKQNKGAACVDGMGGEEDAEGETF